MLGIETVDPIRSRFAVESLRVKDSSMMNFIDKIKENGYFIYSEALNSDFIDEVNLRIKEYLNGGYPGIVYEKDNTSTRAAHGPHLYDSFFLDLCKTDLFLKIAEAYLGEEVYVHQFKINTKAAFEGKAWPWHQDYIYWKEGDHISSPELINISVALDDITMPSGPLCVIPKSHKEGDISSRNENAEQSLKEGLWQDDVSENLSFQVNQKELQPLLDSNGFEFLLCKKGDIIAFDPLLVHSSSANTSCFDRKLMIITYNSVKNLPLRRSKRPEFLCSSNYTPISEV